MPNQHEVDQGMFNKGYRYKLTPINADFAPLFAKTLDQIGPLMRDWKEYKFDVQPLRYDWSLSDLFKLWKDKQDQVIKILGEDHSGLTALFIAQGIADQIINRSDLNTLANKLGELRQAQFQ